MRPVVHDIELERGANGYLWFRPKATVAAPTAIDLTGSSFSLVIIDAIGTVLLTRTVDPVEGIIKFDLSPTETSNLPSGTASSYAVIRITDDTREVWFKGTINAKGIVND